MRISRLRIIPVSILALFCLATHAQTFRTDTAGTVYRLGDDATFQEGCFDPCLCPLLATAPVRGTMVLGRPVTGDVVDFREISEINWFVGIPGETRHRITGTGNYRVTNYSAERLHALELELSIDGGETQFFFSDFVPLDVNDGSFDITVSMNGLFCYDIAIRVDAAPVPRRELISYRLIESSTYQQGCFDPCDCLLEEPRPLRGRFDLVKLFDAGTYAEFAMARVRLGVRPGDLAASLMAYSGFGRYTLIQGFAGPAHAMELALASPLGEIMHFDSGLRNTDIAFPLIDIVVDMNDMVCFDRVIRIRARPRPHVMPMASGPAVHNAD